MIFNYQSYEQNLAFDERTEVSVFRLTWITGDFCGPGVKGAQQRGRCYVRQVRCPISSKAAAEVCCCSTSASWPCCFALLLLQKMPWASLLMCKGWFCFFFLARSFDPSTFSFALVEMFSIPIWEIKSQLVCFLEIKI